MIIRESKHIQKEKKDKKYSSNYAGANPHVCNHYGYY